MRMPQILVLLVAALLALSRAASAEDELVFGVFPYVSPGKLVEFHSPLKHYLSRTLERPVSMVTAPDFQSFRDRTQRGEYDLILTAPHLGRLAQVRDGYMPVVRTMHEVSGVFLVRSDSEIRTIGDLRGKSVMMAAPSSVLFQMALEEFDRQGLTPGQDLRVIETRTHNNAMFAPLRGEADASLTGIKLWNTAAEEVKSQLRVIGETEAVPGFLLLANERLSDDDVQALKELLLVFKDTPEGAQDFVGRKLKGFGEITDKELERLDPYIQIFFQ
jgi:phosphonate transport system substrate-binding protein